MFYYVYQQILFSRRSGVYKSTNKGTNWTANLLFRRHRQDMNANGPYACGAEEGQ